LHSSKLFRHNHELAKGVLPSNLHIK